MRCCADADLAARAKTLALLVLVVIGLSHVLPAAAPLASGAGLLTLSESGGRLLAVATPEDPAACTDRRRSVERLGSDDAASVASDPFGDDAAYCGRSAAIWPAADIERWRLPRWGRAPPA